MTNYSGAVTFNWNFGDGSPHDTNQFPAHVYNSSGTFSWNVTATASNATASANGSIVITAPVALSTTFQGSAVNLSWPQSLAGVVIEQSGTLGAGAKWIAVTNLPVMGPVNSSVIVPVSDGIRFFRARQPW
jgi:PKD repeat protein